MAGRRLNKKSRSRKTPSEALWRIRQNLDFFLEPGRKKIGHSKNDCLALILAVKREDRHTRSCSEELGKEQSWCWLENISRIPVRTIGRILRDFVYLGRELGTSPLSQAAAEIGVVARTEARSQIIVVSPIDHEHRCPPRQVDSIETSEFESLLEQKSAHASIGDAQIPFHEPIEIEVK